MNKSIFNPQQDRKKEGVGALNVAGGGGFPAGHLRPSLLVFLFLFLALFLFSTSNRAQASPEPPAEQSEAVEENHLIELFHNTLPAKPGEAAGSSHVDPVAPVLLEIILIIFAAKFGGHVAERLHQPAVLGELLVGVGIGVLPVLLRGTEMGELIGLYVDVCRTDNSHIDILARIGVILLLFEVGLESSLHEMTRVGVSALLVATAGVVAPFFLGYFVSSALIHNFPVAVEPLHVHLFIGATLAATSVGITARVFKDLHRLKTREAKIVLGAAVIDDVMGLVLLAVVSGIIVAAKTGSSVGLGSLAAWTTLKAVAFLVLAILWGIKVAPHLFRLLSRLHGTEMLITSALTFCLFFAWMANLVGLATIVGAFAAGLVLSETHFQHFKGSGARYLEVGKQLRALTALFVPIFFVQMGIKVDLTTFLNREVLLLALALTVAAIIGKQVCSLCVRGGWASRLSVGIGMVPRGEVGLIFANIGLGLGVVSTGTLSAVVIMVIVTTLITPPLLKMTMASLAPAGETADHDEQEKYPDIPI